MCMPVRMYVHTYITSPVAVPSVVITVTVISVDDGLVRFSVNINDPRSSFVETDDLLKHIIVAEIEAKERKGY